MAKIKSRKHHRSTQLVVLAASIPFISHAAETVELDNVAHLPTISIKSDKDNSYKVTEVTSPKYTQPLIDTPQTISIINKQILQDQGATTLVEALRNTPGITLQLGENGNTSAGDAFQMRGFSTQTSTFVDGIRDLGAVSRDVFNIEQIEVVKGPSGSETGRGAASGYINLVSKLPTLESNQSVSATYKTAEHGRLAADMNQAINGNTAVRLNVMGQYGGVQDRDYVRNNSYAVAPALAFGLDTDTRFYLYSQHVRQRNVPDGGITSIGMKGFYYNNTSTTIPQTIRDQINAAVNNAPKVDRKTFYGNVDDHEDVDADMFTVKIESDLAENLKFTNMSRFGETDMKRVLTGINAVTITDLANPQDRNNWEIIRSRQGVDQNNKILANQSTLNWNIKTGSIEHNVVAGVELLKEEQRTKTMSTQAPGKATPVTPNANLYHPNAHELLPSLVYNGGYADGQTDTAALYLFDTLKFNERFQLNAGVRVDYYETDFKGLTVATAANTLAVTRTPLNLSAHDTLVSWKLGGLFKPTEKSSIYASYAKSLTPPGSANFSLSSSTVANAISNNPIAEPQETHHYEIGTKWDLLNDNLAVNAAVYRTENENQYTIDSITALTVPEGKKRVTGVELSAVGKITDAWNISAGVAHMKVKQLNQRTSATTDTISERWSPEWTASLWSTYDIKGFKVGLGARYVDDQKRVITNSTAPANMPSIPNYVVFDAMAGYTFNKHASMNLNVYNLADKDYINSLNNGGGRLTLGEPRSAAVTFNYKF